MKGFLSWNHTLWLSSVLPKRTLLGYHLQHSCCLLPAHPTPYTHTHPQRDGSHGKSNDYLWWIILKKVFVLAWNVYLLFTYFTQKQTKFYKVTLWILALSIKAKDTVWHWFHSQENLESTLRKPLTCGQGYLREFEDYFSPSIATTSSCWFCPQFVVYMVLDISSALNKSHKHLFTYLLVCEIYFLLCPSTFFH